MAIRVETVYVVGEEGEGDVGLHHLEGWDEVYSNQVESRVPGAGTRTRKGMGAGPMGNGASPLH